MKQRPLRFDEHRVLQQVDVKTISQIIPFMTRWAHSSRTWCW
jgi:hypothetical protein